MSGSCVMSRVVCDVGVVCGVGVMCDVGVMCGVVGRVWCRGYAQQR